MYVIILNWNGIEHLPVCLGSLGNLSHGNTKIVMVDNNSSDGSQEFARREFPEIEIIQNEKNIGFSPANNVGMRYALERKADYVALLNNDMEVDRDWISELVAAAERDGSIGACATKMIYFYNRDIIQGIGICLNRIGLAWDYLNGRYDLEDTAIDGEVIGSCGGAFFARADILEKTGLFDPAYFTYYEDVELSMRIWNEGYRIVTVPAAKVYHKFAATMVENSPWKNYLILRNRIRLIVKCFPRRALARDLLDTLRWELKVARDNYWKRDFRLIASQARSLGAAALCIAGAVSERRRRGPIRDERVWKLVKEDARPYRVRLPQPPSPSWGSPEHTAVELGAGNARRGAGWYLMYDEGDSHYRWFAREASLCLKTPDTKPCTLRVIIGNDYFHLKKVGLTILADGAEIARFFPGEGWNEYRFPLQSSPGRAIRIELRADSLYNADRTGELTDLSFKVKAAALEPCTP